MEKLQLECNEYKLYAPDSLKYITGNMHFILLDAIDVYKKLFNMEKWEQIQINFFDDIKKFRNFIYELRGEKESLPKYAKGTYDFGMINAFIESDIEKNSLEYNHKLYMASHELFHILYMKYILKNDYSKRIIWYDEGMAQLFSLENNDLLNKENFCRFYLRVKDQTKKIPNMNEIEHGNSFCNEFYNGYDLSYLAVRYLYDILSFDEFKKLMLNYDAIKKYGENILDLMFKYYDVKTKK